MKIVEIPIFFAFLILAIKKNETMDGPLPQFFLIV